MPGDPRPRVVSTAASPPVDTELGSACHTPRHDNHPAHDPPQRRAHVSRSALHLTGVRGSHKPSAQTARSRCTRRRLALALDARPSSSTAAATLAIPSPRATSRRIDDSINLGTVHGRTLLRAFFQKEGSRSSNSMPERPQRAYSLHAPAAPTPRARTPPRTLASTAEPPASLSQAPQDDLAHDFPLGHRRRSDGANKLARRVSFLIHLLLSIFHHSVLALPLQVYLCRRAPPLRVPSASRPREGVDTPKTNNTSEHITNRRSIRHQSPLSTTNHHLPNTRQLSSTVTLATP